MKPLEKKLKIITMQFEIVEIFYVEKVIFKAPFIKTCVLSVRIRGYIIVSNNKSCQSCPVISLLLPHQRHVWL